jgi:hypothetical protein
MKGQLVIGYDRNGSPATITIVATGAGTPNLQTPTRRLEFGSQLIDGRPTRRLITLISNGTAAAWLDTYTIQGADAGDFRIDAAHSNCQSLDAIPPGTPSESNSKAEDKLTAARGVLASRDAELGEGSEVLRFASWSKRLDRDTTRCI